MTSFPCHKIWDHPNFSWTSENSNLIKHTSLKVVWLWVTFHGFHDFSLWCSWLVTKPPLKKEDQRPRNRSLKRSRLPLLHHSSFGCGFVLIGPFFLSPTLWIRGWNGNHLNETNAATNPERKAKCYLFHFRGASTHWTCHSLMIISFFDKQKWLCTLFVYLCGCESNKNISYSM